VNDRTLNILETALRDYIKTGAPITSEHLYRFYDFGIKPAMIRWELNDLSDAGYLIQTHHSGGRLPTDKAYRYFTNKLLEEKAPTRGERLENRALEFMEYLAEDNEGRFVEEISRYLNSFSVGYELGARDGYESGLTSLFERLQVESREDLLEVVRDLERLPHRFEKLRDEWFSDNLWPKVFIGENPLTSSKHLSLIANRIEYNDGKLMFLAIGPKRMDYQKSLRLFSNLKTKSASQSHVLKTKKSKHTKPNGRKR